MIADEKIKFIGEVKKYPFYAVHVQKKTEKEIFVFQKIYDTVIFTEKIQDARNYNGVDDIPSVQIVKVNKKNPKLIYAGHTFFSKEAYKIYEKFCDIERAAKGLPL